MHHSGASRCEKAIGCLKIWLRHIPLSSSAKADDDSILEALMIIRDVAAYWIPRLRGV